MDIKIVADMTATEKNTLNSVELKPSYFDDFTQKGFGDGNIAEVFHANTTYEEDAHSRRLSNAQRWFETPNMVKAQAELKPDYTGHEEVPLPEPVDLDTPIGETLMERSSEREMAGDGCDLTTLSTLLKHACGVNRRKEVEITDDGTVNSTEQAFRTYPSGGALYPIEVYLLQMNDGEDLERGLYFYEPREHRLRVLECDEDLDQRSEELFEVWEGSNDPAEASTVFVMVANLWRTFAKYGPRGYRAALVEAGHIGQNIQLTAGAIGLASVPLLSYKDGQINDYIGIDGVNEAVLYTVSVGISGGEDNE